MNNINTLKLASLSALALLTLSCGKNTVTRVESSGIGAAELGAPIGIQTENANAFACPNGGTTLIVFLDSNRNNLLEEEELVVSQNNICNGSNGNDGADGANGADAAFTMGSVGPSVTGENYSACHHDYLYIANSQNPSRGWLTFRHQGNGSHDQGIGSTGFQIWNVDIDVFSLASEVNGVIYCNLSWDPITRILSYTVVDNSDGLAGLQDSIQL
ncbi:MAG: hypothetical protein R3A80_11470 [Bdellovibrionota bacterium]